MYVAMSMKNMIMMLSLLHLLLLLLSIPVF